MASELTLPLLLKQLGLSTMYEHYAEQAEIAQEKRWSHQHYLSVLGDMEVASRYQRRVARHLKESKLPTGKTLDNFDFSVTKSINSVQLQALADDTSWVVFNNTAWPHLTI